MKKIKDAVVKTGTYESNGETKNNYLNVGSLMEGEEGNQFLLLDVTFNPAGLKQEGKRSVLINFYDVKSKGERQPTQHDQAKQDAYQAPAAELDDEIPF